jgi:ABC-2 type transport system permease protein
MILRILSSFFLRDARQALSYRLSFFLDMASVFFNAATFYFVAKLLEGSTNPALQSHPGGYFPFVLIGIAFSTYQSVGLNSFSQSLRQEQFLGTLESVLATKIRIPTFLAGSALWDFAYASFEVLIYFVVAWLAFGFSFANTNGFSTFLSCLLTLTTFMGLGILAAAFILRFKRGNPVTWIIASASELFGGVYFPQDVLPEWMKSIAHWVPMTHALSALRASLLSNAHVEDISHDLIFLTVCTLLVWPIGVLAFKWALKRSQGDGSLGHY